MSMTNRGAMPMGGARAYTSPFMDNGDFVRIPITVDNTYNRGRIPAYSLWAPSDVSTNPWKYMPYIPAINITTANSQTSIEIPNQWSDYFRVGDEVFALDISEAGSDNLAFRGLAGTDESAAVLGTNTVSITAVGKKDSGGTGVVAITCDTFHTGAPTGGALGTGDILVLAGSSTSTAIQSYQEADNVVIMEQEFDFADAITGTSGEGGYLVESCIYAYTGRIDYNLINYYTALNTFDSSPALTVCGQYTGDRLRFVNVYRG